MLQWNPDFFPGFLHTLKIILFSPDFWGMDAPRFFGFVLSLSTLHFTANSILRPQGEMHCLFQYCRIASLYILLFYNSHTRFIRTGFHTKHKNERSTLFLPLFLYHCTQHVLLLANCHTNPSAGARGFFSPVVTQDWNQRFSVTHSAQSLKHYSCENESANHLLPFQLKMLL